MNLQNSFFFFCPLRMICRITVPGPGIEPWASVIKATSPNYWTTSTTYIYRICMFHNLFIKILLLLTSLSLSVSKFSHSVVYNSLWPHGLQHTRTPCPSSTLGTYSNSCPLCQWCHPPSYPLSSPSPLALNLSQHQGLFQWVSSSHQVAKVLEF